VANDLRVRATASTSARVVTSLQRGSPVDVMQGPVQAEGLTWLRIRTGSGVEGWTVATAIR
jgi:hypothetical protein